jgi:hypothetical protein
LCVDLQERSNGTFERLNNSGGKWTTKKHVEDDPSFGPDLKEAGGWTDINRVVDTFMLGRFFICLRMIACLSSFPSYVFQSAIADENMSGDTLVISGNYPVQRKRLHMTKAEYSAFMSRREFSMSTWIMWKITNTFSRPQLHRSSFE